MVARSLEMLAKIHVRTQLDAVVAITQPPTAID
jgi:hypothetical protein